MFFFDEIIEIDPVKGNNIYVDINGNGNYEKIQDAINASKSGDTIYVWDGVYYENVFINKTVTLIGNGTDKTVINANQSGDAIRVEAYWVNITGFTLTNSSSGFEYAGVLMRYSNYSIVKNCNISGNKWHGVFMVDSTG